MKHPLHALGSSLDRPNHSHGNIAIMGPGMYYMSTCEHLWAPMSISNETSTTCSRLHTNHFAVLAKIISGLPDKLSGRASMRCQTFWFDAGHFSQLMTGKYYVLCRTFLSSLSDNFRVLNPAGQNVQQWWSPLLDISRSLSDMSSMSGIFREDWLWTF